jgi:hypothetical protein
MGFDLVFFGRRIDHHQDLLLRKRHHTSQCEGVWRGSSASDEGNVLGSDADAQQVFWGLTDGKLVMVATTYSDPGRRLSSGSGPK